MIEAAKAAGATVVGSVFHPFTPQGLSGVVVVEESHLSIHTWPERGYAAVDFYTCGECEPERAHAHLVSVLKPRRSEVASLERGLGTETQPGIGLRHHKRISYESEPEGAAQTADLLADGAQLAAG